MPGGVAPLGPVGAPVLAQPNVGGEIAQAIGQYPADKQKYDYQQAEIDAQNMQNASQKLTVLNKMISANPSVANNPQISQAVQRAFQQMGMPAPMKSVNGVQQLDTDTLASLGPIPEFIAQNLKDIVQLPPDVRETYLKLGTSSSEIPKTMLDSLNKLPQQTSATADELLGILGKSVQSLNTPGGDIGNVIAMIQTLAPSIAQKMGGVDPQHLIDTLKPNLIQEAIAGAKYNLLLAQTSGDQAHAAYWQAQITEIPARINEMNAHATSALEQGAAATSNAATHAALEPSQERKNNADADNAEAKTRETNAGVIAGTKPLKALLDVANENESLSQKLGYDLNGTPGSTNKGAQGALDDYKTANPQATVQNDPKLKELNDRVYAIKQNITKVDRAKVQANQAYTDARARLHAGGSGGDQPHAIPPGATPGKLPNGKRGYMLNNALFNDDGSPYKP
jgi:hypothetical protein